MRATLTAALTGLVYSSCRQEELVDDGATLVCGSCGRVYPLVAGIPDLRLHYDDPYVTMQQDVERAGDLEKRFVDLDFPGLLRLHWGRSGTTGRSTHQC